MKKYADEEQADAERKPLLQSTTVNSKLLPPPDRYNLVYWLFFLEGLGALFPWNSFITVTDYFSDRLEGSQFQGNFENYVTFSFQGTSLLTLALITKFDRYISLTKRVSVSLVSCFLVFLITAILVKVDVAPDTFFYVTMITVVAAGATTAFLQGGLFALAGIMPARYTQATMSGQGLAGVTVALLNIVTQLSDDDSRFSGLLFFSLAVAIIALCLVGFFFMMRLDLVRFYLDQAQPMTTIRTNAQKEDSSVPLWYLFNKIRLPALCVMSVFLVCLSIFPTVTGSISSYGSGKYADKFFVPVYCFLGFNLFDFIGRSAAGWRQFPSLANYRLIAIPILARFAFIPLFMLCNVQFSGATNHFPTVFSSDAWPYIFMVGFAFTNGYLGSLCMMFGPSIVDPSEAQTAASMMVWFLSAGLAGGTLVSFAIKAMMCSCNPFGSS